MVEAKIPLKNSEGKNIFAEKAGDIAGKAV